MKAEHSINSLAKEFFRSLIESEPKFDKTSITEFEKYLHLSPNLYFEVGSEWAEAFKALKTRYAVDWDFKILSKIHSMQIFISIGTVSFYKSQSIVQIFDPAKKSFEQKEREFLDELAYRTEVVNEFKDFELAKYKKICLETLTCEKKIDCLQLCQNILEQGTYSKVALVIFQPRSYNMATPRGYGFQVSP